MAETEPKKTSGMDNTRVLSSVPEDELPDSVLNFWWPVAYQHEILPKDKAEELFATELFGEPLVIFRNSDGKLVCIQDVCPHRSTPLSLGFVREGELYCRYHGWRFGGEEGQCTAVPSNEGGRVPRGVKTQGHPVVEAQNLIWVFPGDAELAKDVPLPPEMPEENDPDTWPMVSQVWESDYSYISIMENLLDPCHLQFTHEGKQQKNIAEVDAYCPDAFKFKLWDYRDDETLPPYTIASHIVTDATKKPMNYKLFAYYPCLQRAEVKLKSGWTFMLNHYVTPLRPGKTRIFLKTARNFIKFIPHEIFAKSNDDVMQQDLCVLTAQQMRLRQGASRWNFPVPADAVSMSYRKFWEASVDKNPNIWFDGFTRTNVVKNVLERGCTRSCAGDIEDLPKHLFPGGGEDHQKGITKLWKSSPAQAWPSKARTMERAGRAPHALGNVGMTGRSIVPTTKKIGYFFAALVVVSALMMAAASTWAYAREGLFGEDGITLSFVFSTGVAVAIAAKLALRLTDENASFGKTL